MDPNLFNLLRDYTLEELLEQCNISDEDVLEALYLQGYAFPIPQGTDYGNIEQNTTTQEK